MTPPAKVLIVKPSSLGDVVTAMPVLRGLRRTFPNVHISWFISNACASLIQHDTDVNRTILFDRKKLAGLWRSPAALGAFAALLKQLRSEKFDWVIDLQGLFRSAFFTFATWAAVRAGFATARELAPLFYTHKVTPQTSHTVDQNIELARSLGIDARPEDMTLQVSPDAREQAAALLARHGLREKGFIICVPPTRWESKRYATRHWRTVVAELSRRVPVVLLGSKDPLEMQQCAAVAEGLDKKVGCHASALFAEACPPAPDHMLPPRSRGSMAPAPFAEACPAARVINLAGQTNIPQFVAVIAASRGLIGSDSAAKFIAPAVGVDVVTIIGPTRTDRTGPYLKGSAVVAAVPCQGCLRRRCSHITCMELIDPRQVLAAAERFLG